MPDETTMPSQDTPDVTPVVIPPATEGDGGVSLDYNIQSTI